MAERLFVRDLMTVGVATCAMDAPIGDIARLLLDKDLEAVAVLNPEGHAVGVVSQDDLVKAYSRDDCRELTAEKVMRDDVPQIPPDIPLAAAAQIMRDQKTRVFFLMHHAEGLTYPAGVLTYRHFLRQLAAQDDSELVDLGVKAARQAPLETFIEKRDAARRQVRPSDWE
ncbi:MAG: CBS domain-containing protein [Anaerolineae bacterium]|nr:CBS domain-containing protein [Anaerolineae bacterium]